MHRRHPPRRDVLHPVAEERVSRQVQLAGQRRMEVDAVPAVRPVVQESCGVEQRPGRRPRTGRRPSCSHHCADMTWLYRYAGSSQVRPRSPTVGTSAARATARTASVASPIGSTDAELSDRSPHAPVREGSPAILAGRCRPRPRPTRGSHSSGSVGHSGHRRWDPLRTFSTVRRPRCMPLVPSEARSSFRSYPLSGGFRPANKAMLLFGRSTGC